MAPKSLEEKIASLEETIVQLKHEIERLEARNECENMMGRYAFYHSAGKNKEIVELFALKNPNVTGEITDRGVYVGEKSLRSLLEGAIASSEGDRIGYSVEHHLTNPVIEVAKDGKTAKGVWMTPGHRVVRDKETGIPKGAFNFTKDAAHFIKEDGKWKILHWHSYPNIEFKFEVPEKRKPRGKGTAEFVKEYPSDRPTTYFKPYDPDGLNENNVPAPPEPYDTFNPNTPLP